MATVVHMVIHSQAVSYRVVNLTYPNVANVDRILGTIEIEQCTIASDEKGDIDKHPDLISILKPGHSARGKTSKITEFFLARQNDNLGENA